jgi:hypothetical protein
LKIWDGSLGNYKDITLSTEDSAEGTNPEDQGERPPKKQKVSPRLATLEQEVRNLVVHIVKVFHLAKCDDFHDDDILSRVAPSASFCW